MKQLAARSLPFFAVYSAAASLAQAHPGHAGHDDGGFTWDLSHLVSYPWATLGFVALATVIVWAGWNHFRRRQSFLKSTDKR